VKYNEYQRPGKKKHMMFLEGWHPLLIATLGQSFLGRQLTHIRSMDNARKRQSLTMMGDDFIVFLSTLDELSFRMAVWIVAKARVFQGFETYAFIQRFRQL